ncbi:MAG: porin family protein [Treponema sp.]|jgi:hypothetical protein|nr:porin family protein [Treponema sp.]
MVTKMKRTACVLACGLLLSVSAFSDDLKGSFILGAGFTAGQLKPNLSGIENTLLMGGRLHADYAVLQWLSIGIESGFSGAPIGDTDFSAGVVPVLARVAWHPFALQNLDPYLVGKAGYGVGFWTKEGTDYNWTDPYGAFVWGVDVGVRYFFTKVIGAFIEAGYECQHIDWEHPGMEVPKWEGAANGRTYATLGLTVKFGGN